MRRLAIWLVVGGFNTAWGLGLILVLHELLGVSVVLSNLVTYVAGAIVSYLLNQRYTFRRGQASVAEFVRFGIAMAVAFSVAMGALKGLQAAGLPFLVAQVAAIGSYSVMFFLMADLRVFRHRPGQPVGCQDSVTGKTGRMDGDAQATTALPGDLHHCPGPQ